MFLNWQFNQFFTLNLFQAFSEKKHLKELQNQEFLTLEETALYLQCDLMTIVKAVLEGKLKAGKIGDKWYIDKRSLTNYFSQFLLKKNQLYGVKVEPEKQTLSTLDIVTEFKEAYQSGEREFPGISLMGANLSRLILSDLNLEEAMLANADFSYCDLSLSWLKNANLTNANLCGVDLTNSELQFSNLQSANLSNANLTKTNLYGVNLTGANLSGAKLDNTIF